jgi:hypothetical protein
LTPVAEAHYGCAQQGGTRGEINVTLARVT